MKKAITLLFMICLLTTSFYPLPVLAEEEFVNTYHDVEEEGAYDTQKEEVNPQTSIVLPSRFDARDYGWVTPIKSQGSLGTCWAFAAAGAAETSLIKQGYASSSTIDINEIQIAYGFYHRKNDPLNLTPHDDAFTPDMDYLMRGGNNRLTAMYLAQWSSVVNQQDFPYATKKEEVSSNYADYFNYTNTDYIMTDSINIPQQKTAIKEAIIKYGAVAASYYSISSHNNSFIYHDDRNQKSDHAILIVGYDNSISRSLFANSNPTHNIPSQDGAWIIKNSWGTHNGDAGYYYMSYDMTVFSPTAFVFKPRSTYDNNYFYDGSYVLDQHNPWNLKKLRMANVFEVKKADWNTKETLEAVSVGIGTPNTNYSIMIYEIDKKNKKPLSSKKLLSKPQKGHVDYPGNYTIDLDESIELEEGTAFSVEVTLTCPDGSLPKIFVSYTHGYSWLVMNEYVEPNQSYLIYDDSYYLDACDKNGQGYCSRIRAYTKDSTRKYPLPKPVNQLKAIAKDYKTIQLRWDKVANADTYAIYRKAPTSKTFTRYKSTTNNITNITVTTGKKYQFYIRAYNDQGRSAIGKTVTKTTNLKGNIKLSLEKIGKTRFELRWNKVDGATRYIIYRKRNQETYKKVLTLDGKKRSYVTNYLPKGTYSFIVRAARYDSKDRVLGNKSNEVSGTSIYTTPKLSVTKSAANAFKISWSKVEGVQYYRLYRATSKNGKYALMKTTTSTSYINKSLTKGKTYYYKVKGYKKYRNLKVFTNFSNIVGKRV